MSCGCARWLCGRTPRDGAGKYARVQLDEPEDDDEDDYCDASPEANPWEALQERRNLAGYLSSRILNLCGLTSNKMKVLKNGVYFLKKQKKTSMMKVIAHIENTIFHV